MSTVKWPADKVERWSVDKLIPYARNARTHSEDQVAQIAAAIKEWGWTNPVLVDEEGEIIAGHGRVLAARQLALDAVPVMVARGWTRAQKQAYVLADNRLAENAGWDSQLLKIEIGDLGDAGFDLQKLGWDPDELGDIMLAGEGEEGGEGGRGSGNAIVQYNIVFDDDAQQQTWFGLLRRLKERFPEHETIGARLAAFIDEIGDEA